MSFQNSSVNIHGVTRVEVSPNYFDDVAANPFWTLEIRAYDKNGEMIEVTIFAGQRDKPIRLTVIDRLGAPLEIDRLGNKIAAEEAREEAAGGCQFGMGA